MWKINFCEGGPGSQIGSIKPLLSICFLSRRSLGGLFSLRFRFRLTELDFSEEPDGNVKKLFTAVNYEFS
jgi:hypothetical protein